MEILIGTTSSGISYQLRDIYFMYQCFYPLGLLAPKITDRSASYLDLHMYSEGWLSTKLYDKGDDFPFICSNIPAALVHEVYISQLIRYSRACGSYQDFHDTAKQLHLTRKLLQAR
jgi:hypothetical protein